MEIGKATFFENRLKMEPKDLSPSATYKSPNKILKATTKSVGEGASTAEKAAIIKPRGPYGKRDIGSLGENCHEARYRPETQRGYFAEKQRKDTQGSSPSLRKRAKGGASASWAGYLEWKEQMKLSKQEIPVVGEFIESGALDEGMARVRRFAIQYIFVEEFGSPAKSNWGDFCETAGVPTIISRRLKIPHGSTGSGL